MYDSFGGQHWSHQQQIAQQGLGQAIGGTQGLFGSSFGPAIQFSGFKSDEHGKEVKKGGWTMFGSLRRYVDEHSDLLWTVVTIILLDHFLFEGRFKAKIEQMMDGLISKTQNKVHEIAEKVAATEPKA